MNETTQHKLLELNREFYAKIAIDFDETRSGLPLGWQRLYGYFSHAADAAPLRVLDVGCGNGRFAGALATQGVKASYWGIDGSAQLLALATEHTSNLTGMEVHFAQADFTQPGWFSGLNEANGGFDRIVCLAALHHVPGYALRQRVVQELAALLAADGLLIFSNWQFLTSDRFVRKQITWQTIGLQLEDVEPGDALLPWNQGGYAVRYVHQVDANEMANLAHDAGLQVIDTFLADGKEGNLSLYSVLCR